MKNSIMGLLAAWLLCSPLKASDIYNGTLVDAHSQKGGDISVKDLSNRINNSSIEYILLSFRVDPDKVGDELLEIKKLTGGKVRYLIPTKLGGFSNEQSSDNSAIDLIYQLKKSSERNNLNHVGFGEILVQHAPHDHERLKYDGVNFDLNSPRVSRAIQIVLEEKKPVILHLELNDYETASRKILNQIVSLANSNPKNTFLLIHMAQVDLNEAEFIIQNTKNVHFMTSHADKRNQNRKKTGKSQTGWINLLDSDGKIRKNWINLMNKNPKRFLLAFDNVFEHHWSARYENNISKWRRALSSLDGEASISVACNNANEYFGLGIECLRERK